MKRMKTPREILFARHRSAEPKLDAIRQQTVAAVCDRRASEKNSTDRYSAIDFWRELIWPCRRPLAGMAALWLVMWVINSEMFGARGKVALAHSSLPPAMWQTIEERKRLLAELTQPAGTQPVEPPRRNITRPRSETQPGQKTC